ncbi:MAG: DUF5700 domain-containing putative Zn-dependent protease [Kosmotogaceae bacterium]
MLFSLPTENTINYLSNNVEKSYNKILNDLVNKKGEQNIKWLIDIINRLKSPEDVEELLKLQKNKIEMGGGFFGIISEPIKDENEIPVPNSLESFIDLIFYLSNIRESQLNEVENTGYPLYFNNETYKQRNETSTGRVKVTLDLSAIKQLIDYFSCDKPVIEEAERIANSEIFTEMIKHRNSLGYLPGPEMKTEYLSYFIYLGAKKDPVSIIWKWLNPWNCFNFADIFMNFEKFQKLIKDLENNKSNFEALISSKLEPYVPDGFVFKERFVFAVEWAIRGWATSKFGGINIEHVKDNYEFLVDTIVHETYHRIQAMLYPGNTEKDFNMLDKSFDNEKLDAVYKAMTYVFLEGTATYVQYGSAFSIESEKINEAVNLFQRIIEFENEEIEKNKLEEILNIGLKSNGPFYTLGQYMAKIIDETYGNEKLAACLKKGSPKFFDLFIRLDNKNIFPKDLKDTFKKITLP